MLLSESEPQSPGDPNVFPDMQHTFHFNHLNHKSIYLQKFRLYETRSVIVSTSTIIFQILYLIFSPYLFFVSVLCLLIMVACQDYDSSSTLISPNFCLKAFTLLLYCNICFFTSSMSI